MQDLFQGDAESTGPADDLRVVTVLERGEKQARALDEEPEIQADLYQTLGAMYDQLGKYEQADSLLKASLAQRKATNGPDSAKVAESLVALANLRNDQAQLEEAETLARQGLDMSKRHLPPDHPVIGRATLTLGRILDNRGKYDEAIPTLEEAMRLQSGPKGVPADLSATLSELANTHYYLGHYDVSKSLNERALRMDEQIYGDRNPNVAQDLTNLADIQYQWSHYTDAERLQRTAVAIMQAWYGKDHPETADDMTILGKYLIAEDRAVDAAALGDYFAEHPIDVLKIAPSHLSALLAAERERVLPRRLLVIGGEAWRPDLVERLRRLAPGCTVFNHYGPTETTVGVLAFRPPARPRHATVTVPLGRPLAAARCHVLDRHGRPLPAGVAGELYVGGACVARGYLGRPELTADRFVPDPFTPLPGERLYRTGDLVRRLADGSVEFLGRLDHQVKIRGFRIEPGEIEHWLARHPGVAETVVLARRDDAGEALLAAYVVASPGAPAPAAAELRAHLAARLPEAMVPSAFVFLPALPRTAHGKLNRSALPAPERAGERPPQPVTLPRDPIELALAQIWEELLGVHPISVHDDFFELGGHSLLAVRLMSRIERRFGRGLPLSQLSQGATVAAFGRALRAIGGGAAASSPLVEIQPGDGARRPLFLVHPAGGNVLCYLPLARGLGREQPVFGLQDPALFQTGEPGFDVEEMAACYLEALRAVQARGPYVLGGWSLGGVIAQEMAQRLEQGGDDVALLLLLDARCPAVAGREAQDEDQVLLWFAAQLGVEITPGELAAESAKRRFDLVLARARAGGALPADLEPHQARRIFAVYAAEMSAVARHRPRPCRAHALLLRAAAGVAEERSRGEDERLGWAGLTGGEIQTAVVPGSHHTLLEEPAVSAVAEQIRTRLAAISAAE